MKNKKKKEVYNELKGVLLGYLANLNWIISDNNKSTIKEQVNDLKSIFKNYSERFCSLMRGAKRHDLNDISRILSIKVVECNNLLEILKKDESIPNEKLESIIKDVEDFYNKINENKKP